MALWYIVFAAGLFNGNFGSDLIVVGSKKFLVIGPQFPCRSVASGRRIVLAFMSSLIVCSPHIVLVVIVSFLLGRIYFFHLAV